VGIQDVELLTLVVGLCYVTFISPIGVVAGIPELCQTQII
jgi:hypothetical protein